MGDALRVASRLVTIGCLLAIEAATVYSRADESVSQALAIQPADQVADLVPVLAEAEEYEAIHGHPPGVEFYYASVANLSPQDSTSLLYHIIDQQHPQISVDDLAVLFESMRDSIRSFHCEYTVSASSGPSGDSVFSIDDSKVYLKEPVLDPKDRTVQSVSSYDGELFRRVVGHHDTTLDPAGSLMKDGSLAAFNRPDVPLCNAMLFDLNRVGISDPSLADLSKYIKLACVVYEGTRDVGGAACLLVSDGAADIYLDSSRNFAVVRRDNFLLDWKDHGPQLQTVVGRHLSQRTELMEFVDHGNGIWLPNKSITTAFDASGDAVGTRIVSVVKMEVNPEIEKSHFTDIIPDRAYVNDGVNGLIYRQGMRDSIDGMVQRSIDPKAKSRLLLWVNLLAIVVFAGVYFVRRKSISKE